MLVKNFLLLVFVFVTMTIPGIATMNSRLLPGLDKCGTASFSSLYGGEGTNLDEFPWVALLESIRVNGSHVFSCTGVLISERYILTTSNCLKGRALKNVKLVSIRLGEYNTETDIDCTNDGVDEQCAPPPLNVAVEEKILHEDYDPDNRNGYHDIALLRLRRKVIFTDYVKPICLPTSAVERRKSYVGDRLFVAGWGKTENGSQSTIKLKLQMPVKNMTDCSSLYRTLNVRLSSNQMCVGGERGKDTCAGDGGGPLMTISRNNKDNEPRWFVAGIASFGHRGCGMENWPRIYTKVSKYIDWIVGKLRP